ncbi:hypothetical protein ACLMJK_009230 [Lecanora helva]
MRNSKPLASLSPNKTYFPIPSLYTLLSESDGQIIEQILASDFVAPTPQAEQSFAALPDNLRLHPVTIIARAINLLYLWEFRVAHSLLYEFVSGKEKIHNVEKEQSLLIQAFLAYTDIMFNGSFKRARACLLELRDLLAPIELERHTDLTIYLLREYLRLMKEARDASIEEAFDVGSYLKVIKMGEIEGLPAVAQLREHLQTNGRWREAIILHDFEDDLYVDNGDKIAAFENSAKSLERVADSSPLFISIKASKIAMLANLYDENNRSEAATKFIHRAKDVCLRIEGKPLPFRETALDFFAYKTSVPRIMDMDVDHLLKLADHYREVKFHRAECLTVLSASTVIMANLSSNQYPGKPKQEAVERRIEESLRHVGYTKMLYLSAAARYSPILNDPETCLQWWKSFNQVHSSYTVWKQQISLEMQWQLCYIQSEKFKAALEAAQRADNMRKECVQFWIQAATLGAPPLSLDAQKSEYSITYSAAETQKSDMFPRYFFEDHNFDITIADPETGTHYYGSLGNSKLTPLRERPFKALLAWLRVELKHGVLSSTDIDIIFEGKFQANGEKSREGFFDSLDNQGLTDAMYGPIGQPVSYERWTIVFSVLENWIRRAESFSRAQRQFMLLEILRARIVRKLPNNLMLHECRRNLDFIPSLESPQDLQNVGDSLAIFRHQCQLAFVQAAHSSWTGQDSWTESMESLYVEAISMLSSTVAEAPSDVAQVRGLDVLSLDIRGLLYYELGMLMFSKFDCNAPIDIKKALGNFWLADLCARHERKILESRDGFKACEDLLKAQEKPFVRDIFPKAMQLQKTLEPKDPVKLQKSIWFWIQQAKSRGLGPLGRYKELDWKYSTSMPNPEAEIKISSAFELPQLETMTTASGHRILFIDYYTDFFWGQTGSPILLAYKSGMTHPQLYKFDNDADISDLRKFKDHFLSALEGDSFNQSRDGRPLSEYWLQKFEFLIRPILDLSEPGDVIAISPCGFLHGLPLHAVLNNNEPLICRNPIVYTTGLRSLWYSFLSRLLRRPSAKGPSPRGQVFCGTPFTAGQASAQKVSKKLRSDAPLTATYFSKNAFIKTLDTDSDIIHCHSHATSEPDDPFAQALECNDGPLTVRELLDTTPASTGQHITLLGCSSGVTVKSMSNEPLGLVPTLIHLGASSVVSVLWPIDDKHAATFSDVFYENVMEKPNNSEPASHQTCKDTPSGRKEQQTSKENIPLPAGWEMRLTDKGKSYYVDHNTQTTTWTDPRGLSQAQPKSTADSHGDEQAETMTGVAPPGKSLPAGWESRLTPQGKTYYVDHNTQTTTWTDPRGSSQDRAKGTADSGGENQAATEAESSASSSKPVNLALATQKAILQLMYGSNTSPTAKQEAINADTYPSPLVINKTKSNEASGARDATTASQQRRAPLRQWAGFVLNGWWML